MPAALAAHIHVTEREPDGTWEDCTWCSGLEWFRLVRDPKVPATHAEMQALRAASGEPTTGGSSIVDLRRGLLNRYGFTAPPAISGFSPLWSAMNGRVAVAQGSMKAFGPSSTFSRFDPSFDGAHAVMVFRPLDQDRVWWCDPEAPAGSYQGQWMLKADFARFVNALNGSHLVGAVKEASISMAGQAIHTSEAPVQIDIPLGAILYDLDGVTAVGKLNAAYPGRFSPYAISGGQAIYAGTFGKSRATRIVRQYSNVRAVTDPTPYSQASLDTAKADGVQQERSRLRKLLGL